MFSSLVYVGFMVKMGMGNKQLDDALDRWITREREEEDDEEEKKE